MTPALRLLTAADTAALSTEMARAVEAGDMLASSDPVGSFVMKGFALDPGQFCGAFDGDALVGFASPEFKIAVVRPDRRRQGIGRALVDFADDIVRGKGRPEQLMGVVPGEPVGQAFLEATGFAYHSTVWDLDLPPDRPVGPPDVAGGPRRSAVRRRARTSSPGSASSTPRSPTTRRRSSSTPRSSRPASPTPTPMTAT